LKTNAEENICVYNLGNSAKKHSTNYVFSLDQNDLFVNEDNLEYSFAIPHFQLTKWSELMDNSISTNKPLSTQPTYELNDGEIDEGEDEYLFGERTTKPQEAQERRHTIIDNILDRMKQKKFIPLSKISAQIEGKLTNSTKPTTLSQLYTSVLEAKKDSKPRFFMALLHLAHHTNCKGHNQIELTSIGEQLEEIKVQYK